MMSVSDDKRFKHSGDLGDLWYSLPVVSHHGGGEIALNPEGLPTPKMDGSASGLTRHMIEMCRPLLESQSYIKKVSVWDRRKVDCDLDLFRIGVDYNKVNLCRWILKSFRVGFEKAADTAWITCGENRIATTVFARSFRYRNPGVNLKEVYEMYRSSAVFVGLPDEHKNFEQEVGKIAYQRVKNFLEMAEIINGADLFVGNQSSPMALAIALNKPFVQEVCRFCPNCIFNSPARLVRSF